MRPPSRIVHIISGLQMGGAEQMLTRLLGRFSPNFEHLVISLTNAEPLGERIRALGIPLVSLELRRDRPNPLMVLRALAAVRRFRPEIIESWLYHADLFAVLARLTRPSARLVWNLRCSDMDLTSYHRTTQVLPSILARLSRLPDVVVANSEAGRRAHAQHGYRPRRWEIIPNGFDLEQYRVDVALREEVRRELDVRPDEVLIGLAARVDPMKDHENFCAAAGLFSRQSPARFVLFGRGTETGNAELQNLIRKYGVADRTLCLGERHDLDRLFHALDVATLSSAFGEGFPNVLGEAMACGIPCVTTDVGDAATIVGETGLIVSRRDPEALSRAWLELARRRPEERAALGGLARRRIEERYGIAVVAQQYEALYNRLLAKKAADEQCAASPV